MSTYCWGSIAMSDRTDGDYLPIIILPAPQLQQIADVNTSIHIAKDLTVSGEFAASSLNPNRFAANDEITGDATKFSTEFCSGQC